MPVAGALYYHLNQGAATELPVVLLHGAGGMHLSWPPEIRRLPGYRVFALDLPGHGKSDQVGGLQSITAYAQHIEAWLEAVDLSGAIFVGHSMGGAIALEMALQFPEQVLGLGLISTGPRLRVHPDLLAAAASPTTYHQAIESILAWSFSSQAPQRLVELVSQRLAEVRPSVLHGDLLACDRFDASELVQNITCPVMVLCGTADRMTPLRTSQVRAGLIPGAQLVTIPDAGHMVMQEQPGAVADALEQLGEQLEALPVGRRVAGQVVDDVHLLDVRRHALVRDAGFVEASGTSLRSPMLAYWASRLPSRIGPMFRSDPDQVMARHPRSSVFSKKSTSSRLMRAAIFSNARRLSSHPWAIISVDSSVSGRPDVFVIWRM